MNFKQDKVKVGLAGIGLATYWEQFEGLEERLGNYLLEVDQQLQRRGAEVLNAGLVDTIDKAFEGARRLKAEGVELLFIYNATYALSSMVLPLVRQLQVPVILLNLSPASSIDYASFNRLPDRKRMTAEWLAYCGACPVPEIANVLTRANIPFYEVVGLLDDQDPCWQEIGQWLQAAQVKATLAYNRMGCLGHYYSGMLDIYTDLTKLLIHFGGHIELLEVEELVRERQLVSEEQVHLRSEAFHQVFDVQSDCSPEDLTEAARTSVGLEALVDKYKLGSLAYYYKGSGSPENELAISSIILGNSWLTGRNVPVAGEYEIKNMIAMKILDTLGVGGSFTEYYALDFDDDVVLMGHDGPGHIRIAEGKIKVKPLQVYHGKVGRGLSVEMSVKHGPVTLLSVVEDAVGGFKLLFAEGHSVPGPILEIGNTNSRYRFDVGMREFVKTWNSYGPAHHCTIGVGHVGPVIHKLGALLGLAVVQV